AEIWITNFKGWGIVRLPLLTCRVPSYVPGLVDRGMFNAPLIWSVWFAVSGGSVVISRLTNCAISGTAVMEPFVSGPDMERRVANGCAVPGNAEIFRTGGDQVTRG